MPCFPKSWRKGKKNKKRKSEDMKATKQAIRKLEDTQKMLEKQQADLEKEIEACVLSARENASSKKRVALRALQKKKYLEKKLEKVDNFLTSVEQQKDALEESPTTAAVMVSLKHAGDVLKKGNITLVADNVNDIMDDIAEHCSVSNEISSAFRSSIVLETTEEELLEELERLEFEELNKKFIQVPELTELPSVSKEMQIEDTSEPKKASKKPNVEEMPIKSEPV